MTQTKREILEACAKVCGYDFVLVEDEPHVWGGLNNNYQFPWNPLTNPGDCADMEEKLSIDIRWYNDFVSTFNGESEYMFEYFSNHPNRQAARMMASTRCAAEVARRMESHE